MLENRRKLLNQNEAIAEDDSDDDEADSDEFD